MDPRPDVLLTDVSLPDIAGPALGDRLLERWPGMRVVLMSGYFEESLRARASSCGWHFLQKPFELVDLAATLQTAIDTSVVAMSIPAIPARIEPIT
jgi:two-component system cell cycle sensor histidine kinase/response regulator CckA